MRVLVTGQSGQIARAIGERFAGHKLLFAGQPGFDLSNAESIRAAVWDAAPELVISAAAYTAVDKAEDEPERAMAVNGRGPAILAQAAREAGVPILHLSTDYVFDGSLDRPWREEDPVEPIGVYGRSKLAGERAIAQSGAAFAILRTAWVYSPFGNNFVKTMLKLAESHEHVAVVADQWGCPTSAHDIADALLAIVDAWSRGERPGVDEVYHFAGSGETNWADFARAIFEESRRYGGPSATIDGISSSAFPTRARRPANSRLDCTRFAEAFGLRAPPWRDSLSGVVARLVGEIRN